MLKGKYVSEVVIQTLPLNGKFLLYHWSSVIYTLPEAQKIEFTILYSKILQHMDLNSVL